MFASGVRNNFPQVCFPRVGNWRVARFFMFVRQFNDFCELLSRIFRNARQRNVFLSFWDTFSTVVQNGIVGSVFSPSSRNCFYNGIFFAQLNRRRGIEIWRALALLWTLTTIHNMMETGSKVAKSANTYKQQYFHTSGRRYPCTMMFPIDFPTN